MGKKKAGVKVIVVPVIIFHLLYRSCFCTNRIFFPYEIDKTTMIQWYEERGETVDLKHGLHRWETVHIF